MNSNSQYFAILINSQSNNISRAKALSTGGNCYNSRSWREGLCENGLEDRVTKRKQEVKGVKRVEKNAQES